MNPPRPAPLRSWRSFVRFGIVGGLCFVTGMAGVWLLTEGLGWHYLLSTLLAMLAANGLGWLLNRSWTYALQRRRTLPEFLRYLAVNLAGMGLSLALLALLVSTFGLHYLAACALVAIGMSLLNFQLHGRWSLRVHRDDAHAPPR